MTRARRPSGPAARIDQRLEAAQRDALEDRVAERGRLDRPGDDGHLRVCGEARDEERDHHDLNRFKPIRPPLTSSTNVSPHVRTVLCYGDSNTWGCVPLTDSDEPPRRYPPHERWPGVLRRELGPGYWVVEEGLNGRTTVWDDGLEPHRNGMELLMPALLSHWPIDVVVIMLGTNDLKRRIGVSAAEIAEGAGTLVDVVRTSGCGANGGVPEVVLVCPPPLGRVPQSQADFAGGWEKSRELAAAYDDVARRRSCGLVDAGAHISTSDVDGVHLDREAHAVLGSVVAQAVGEAAVHATRR